MNAEAFLPRSNSRVVVALTLGAYVIVLERLLFVTVLAFTVNRQPRSTFAAYGPWAEALDPVILFPIVAGLVLVATIELLRLLRLPPVLQIVLAAAGSCAINGIFWWPAAIIAAPLFLLSAIAYLRWRRDSWWVALIWTTLIIAFSSLPAGIGAFRLRPVAPPQRTNIESPATSPDG